MSAGTDSYRRGWLGWSTARGGRGWSGGRKSADEVTAKDHVGRDQAFTSENDVRGPVDEGFARDFVAGILVLLAGEEIRRKLDLLSRSNHQFVWEA